MTMKEWQAKHGLDDETMRKIVLIKKIFNATKITVTDLTEKRSK